MKESQNSNTFIYIVLGLIIAGIVIMNLLRSEPKVTPPGALELAQCLTEKGVKFYGASWCSHCQDQKDLFGEAAKKLPYVECAVGNQQAKACTDAGIEGYPTWKNSAGEKKSGVFEFDELAKFSGCTYNPI